MNLRELALEALDAKEAEEKEAILSRAQSTHNLARAKFEELFGVEPESFEAVAGYGGGAVDVVYQDVRLRYGLFGAKGKFFMIAACPECGQEVKGHASITDLAALGKALRDFEPNHEHICPAVVAPTITPVLPTWQDLLDAINRIADELARANDRVF